MRLLPLYRGPLDQGIPGEFGYCAPFRCATCGPIREVHGVETIPGSWDGPSEGFDYCPACGSTEVRANDDARPFRVVRRRRIHSNHHTGIAA